MWWSWVGSGLLAVARVDRQGAPDVGGHRRRSFDQHGRERRHRLVEQRHLGEVEQCQRGVGGVAGDETVDDGGTELVDGGGGVVGEQLKRPVVPPGAGLQLGAGDEPIGVRGEGAGDLVRRHQASVEAEKVEPLDTGVGEPGRQCRLDLDRFQQALGTVVGADTGPGRSVIADDHRVVLSREGGDPFGDEPRQRRRVAHVGRAEIGKHLGVAGLDVDELGADPVADVQHGLLAVLG